MRSKISTVSQWYRSTILPFYRTAVSPFHSAAVSPYYSAAIPQFCGAISKKTTAGRCGVLLVALWILLFWSSPPWSGAQTLTHGDPFSHYIRHLPPAGHYDAIPGSWLIGPLHQATVDSYGGVRMDHPWRDHIAFQRRMRDPFGSDDEVRIFSPRIFASHNSEFPSGGNDGALWQGKGWNTAMSTGIHINYGPLRMDLRPVFVHSQNRDFDLSPIPSDQKLPPGTEISEFAEPLVRADLPQRFGTDPVSRLDAGNSAIRLVSQRGLAVGVSHATIRTGPAVHNPLILSNNAPGFWHGYAGSEHPVITGIGDLEFRFFWGGLNGSDYYLDRSLRRYTTGVLFTWAPEFLSGLQLGFKRVAFGRRPDTFWAPDYLFRAFQSNPEAPEEGETPDDDFFAMHSFSARWKLPDTGFEVYGEWGRNDYNRPIRDFFLEPELNRGYVIGFRNRFTAGPRHWLVLHGEMTQLENSAISALQRPRRVWYEHESIHGGFTHRGQNLGAAIGPGSSAQIAGLHWYNRFGMLGVTAGRIVHNNDRLFNFRDYYEDIQPNIWNTLRKLHEVEMRFGVEALVFLPQGMELQAGLTRGRIENRYNVIGRDETNIRLEMTLRVTRPGWLR